MEVRGYIRPESCFATISEWEDIARLFLLLQRRGVDTRGGIIDSDPKLAGLIMRWFGHQLHVETQLFDQLTQKNVLDFIEDFVNHRVWGLRREFGSYFDQEDNLLENIKIAYFFSRGDIEPYVLLDDDFVMQVYGTTTYKVQTKHWTTEQGLKNIADSLDNKHSYAISTFTKQWKPFFRKESNVLVLLEGELRAAFRSDVKSLATDKGNRAVNMYRLAYPEGGSNLCMKLDNLDIGGATSLWNEFIIKPTAILKAKKIPKQ
jgi:hypothetical protein